MSVMYSRQDSSVTRGECTTEQLQHVQRQQDKINDAINALQCNSSVLKSLRNSYHDLSARKTVALNDSRQHISKFLSEIEIITHDYEMQILRTTHLERMIQDRKDLVGLSQIMFNAATAHLTGRRYSSF